jgi:hypothetical protein
MNESDLGRFLDKVKIDPETGCWNWTAGKFSSGYGAFSIGSITRRAHKVSYEHYVGIIPEGLIVCHRCPDGENRICVNPDHLWLGTHQDNSDDKALNDMQPRGEKCYQSKLTESDVIEIRELYGTGIVSHADLAAHKGVSKSLITKVLNYQVWSHV